MIRLHISERRRGVEKLLGSLVLIALLPRQETTAVIIGTFH
jgi:hypothetical protein